MNLTAYFDESGTHEDSKVVSVAGFVSTESNWIEFSRQWEQALKVYGLSHFHMTDFAVKAPPYDKWTEAERRECLNRFITIINTQALWSVGKLIPIHTFERVFTTRAKRICGGAYGLATTACFIDLAEFLRNEKVDGRIAYVFEAGARGRGEIAKVFGVNLKDPESKEHFRLLSLRFEDKRDFLPLQAADLLAYELYRELPRDPRWGWERKRPRYPLAALATLPHAWHHLEEDELRKWSAVLSQRAAMEDSGELPPL